MRGTFLGVPIRRIIVFMGLYCGPPYFGKLPYGEDFERLPYWVSSISAHVLVAIYSKTLHPKLSECKVAA